METTSPILKVKDLDPEKLYSYADYLTWNLEERIELIHGEFYIMEDAPLRRHQGISARLMNTLMNQLEYSLCQVYAAPFDVRLPGPAQHDLSDTSIFNVVQPDLVVICDLKKLDDKGCIGAPELVIEILSPGNQRRDVVIKKALYEESGVKEYWIVSPEQNTVEMYTPDEAGKFKSARFFGMQDLITVSALAGITVTLENVFSFY